MKYIALTLLCLSTFTNACFADSLTSNQIGNFTFTNGYIGNQSYSTVTQKIGNFEFTNGYLGNKPINTTSQQIGSFKFINGNLGGLGQLDDCDY